MEYVIRYHYIVQHLMAACLADSSTTTDCTLMKEKEVEAAVKERSTKFHCFVSSKFGQDDNGTK